MGLKTITNTCMFICDRAMVPVPCKLSITEPNIKLSEHSQYLLTDKCRLNGCFGPCSIIPDPAKEGAPGGMCEFAPVTWNNISSKIVINGVGVLTDKSSLNCALGGTIKPVMNPPYAKINIDMPGNADVLSAIFSPEMITSDDIVKETPHSDNGSKITNKDELPTQEIQREKHEDLTESDTQINDEKEYPYANCDYKNCSERNNCPYLKADHSESSIKNDSSVLLENYKIDHPQQYEEYMRLHEEKNRESTEGNWLFAAHHIISGNQIFAKHPHLVKLANYYGYDINNSENCILLPSIWSFDGKTGIVKQANGYVAMDMMKKQWHLGGHSYNLEKETVEEINRYLRRIAGCNVSFYKDYVAAVEHEINILESRYRKNSCRKTDYEEKKRRFINGMNEISHKVGFRISEFENGYKRSYPFYVSKEACKFAFDVPNKKKFVIIYSKTKYKTKQILAVKLNVTRYKKDDYKVLFSGEGEFIINDAKSFIIFADNSRYFINLAAESFMIPWRIDPSREYVLNDEMKFENVTDYCSCNEQKIISFVEGRENGEMNYESPAKIIKQRLNNTLGDQ